MLPDQLNRLLNPTRFDTLCGLNGKGGLRSVPEGGYQVKGVSPSGAIVVFDRNLILNVVHVRMGEEDVSKITLKRAFVSDFAIPFRIHEGTARRSR
uniref:Uncharacterized protein n=1 Tax=Rhodopseudomonas palustris (strain BisA53) TaxID=316055 RepID=Q07NW3_RHOP5